ncbi:MAG: hypothetical protein DCF30_19040 [Hyphomicrobiales bacterium]|nr:MAG: hypothetical protein DCF30_19040 [Hyphomicrobiales bacterium]
MIICLVRMIHELAQRTQTNSCARVELSAFNTAASNGRPRAEGLSGLTRSFLAAGARCIVVNRWAIPSGPAVELTTTMVKAKQSGAETN